MSSEAFNTNIEWNFAQIAVFIFHADQVNGRAKSGYYKAAILLAASIAEAFAFKILEKNNGLPMPPEDWRCVYSNPLPSKYKSNTGNLLSICERIQPTFKLTTQTDFKKVNEVCKKLGLFDKKLFIRIERVRILRNKIHIQSLDNVNRSYTRKQLENVSSVINDLVSIYEK
jgi:hypothetical protein